MTETVLAYIINEGQVLLLYRNKKENDINKGKWIGVGGHIEKGETPEAALLREVKEETGLEVSSFQKRGEILFVNDDFKELMHLYLINGVFGEKQECDEGELKAFPINEIFSLPMWEGDRVFLEPLFNTNDYFEFELIYSKDKLLRTNRTK